MEVNELLQSINELLAQGLKVSEAEKQLGFSDGQARKQLSKAGYKFDRKTNQYVSKDGIVTGSNGVTMQEELKGEPQRQEQGAELKQVVTGSNGILQQTEQTHRQELEPQQKPLFTAEQVDILHRIINEYQTRQHVQAVSTGDKGKTINRNVRVYEKQYEAFATWCKANNLTQADALYRAIEWLMNDN